ncbi:MAG: shikimate dehydrogenase [Acidobacteria bacterium RIFCSPLOWO2_12_FULL_65_11]|nr:MAG: shikimate dehydrogenase [Acidobacteria bacterium RIFCSPLOWO2_02_FULL_64_15]OFW30335.1 MAG: shikimate dehydrogenase [Acidobacteria bacterium RIFCSPLOWO2_12_FULL_65_11]
MPLLCVTVTAPTTAELRRKRDQAAADADIVELRLDSVKDPDVAAALAGRRGPVIVTCRPTWEGGRFGGAEEERRRILGDAIALGAEYVDIEWRAEFGDLLRQTGGRRIVLSFHDFDGVPNDLGERVQTMRASGAEVVKIAVKTRQLADCVPLIELGARMGQGGGYVAVGMGDCGLATRVLAGRFGSMWTYAGSEHQVGQLTTTTLLNDYHFRTLTDATDVYGLVGLPVSHSVSPAMHNAAFVAAEVDAVYLPFPTASAEDFVTFGRAMNIKGASVTIPHKVSLADRVDEVDAVARRVGAINTVRVIDGRWIGGNSDVGGFLAPLKGRVSLPGLRAAVLGAGGAARAVAIALGSSGCRVRLHARNTRQAEVVAAAVLAESGPYPPEPGSWDMLVNCTPVGTYPRVDDTPIDARHLTGRHVYDLVYNPIETRLLREAARAGCQTTGGLDMLVGQAQEQCQWWTGVRPPAAIMREAALKRLAEFTRDANHVV